MYCCEEVMGPREAQVLHKNFGLKRKHKDTCKERECTTRLVVWESKKDGNGSTTLSLTLRSIVILHILSLGRERK